MSPRTSARIAGIIESDEVYTANMACVLHRYRQHKITDHMFVHYQDWLMRSSLRRHHLGLRNGVLVGGRSA